ncbi:7128_t:CDS:2 [Dentiscutata erythropus]|uniref:7128_t:CDS:1 n=1 Tax=Dentiscutata erythropus TaxID=1348616 RepID=A0A9N8ZSY4_9GLOM|nr:7128_t:CDS:2 [Dentiscutata erythropus]
MSSSHQTISDEHAHIYREYFRALLNKEGILCDENMVAIYGSLKFILCCQWREKNPIGAAEIQTFNHSLSSQHHGGIGVYVTPTGYSQGAIKEAMNSSTKILLCTDKDIIECIKLTEANFKKIHPLNYDDVVIEGLNFERGEIKSIRKITMKQRAFVPY